MVQCPDWHVLPGLCKKLEEMLEGLPGVDPALPLSAKVTSYEGSKATISLLVPLPLRLLVPSVSWSPCVQHESHLLRGIQGHHQSPGIPTPPTLLVPSISWSPCLQHQSRLLRGTEAIISLLVCLSIRLFETLNGVARKSHLTRAENTCRTVLNDVVQILRRQGWPKVRLNSFHKITCAKYSLHTRRT